jgi:hypothetical protein
MSSGSSTKDLDEIENIPVCNNIQVDLRDPIKIHNDDDMPGKQIISPHPQFLSFFRKQRENNDENWKLKLLDNK